MEHRSSSNGHDVAETLTHLTPVVREALATARIYGKRVNKNITRHPWVYAAGAAAVLTCCALFLYKSYKSKE